MKIAAESVRDKRMHHARATTALLTVDETYLQFPTLRTQTPTVTYATGFEHANPSRRCCLRHHHYARLRFLHVSRRICQRRNSGIVTGAEGG